MDTKKIGAFIAFNRKKKGYTQEQLAEKLGVTNKTISRWENGHYMPDLSGSLTLAHSQNSQMSFMYGFFFAKFLFFTVVCVVTVI